MILFKKSSKFKPLTKILILSTLLLISFVPGVFAGPNDLGVVISSGSGLPGDQVSVTINLENVAASNTAIGTDGIYGSNFWLTYDSNAFQVGTISAGSLFTVPSDFSSSKTTLGKISLLSLDNSGGENLITTDGLYATIPFTIKAGTPAGDYTLDLESNVLINGLTSLYAQLPLPIQKTVGKITVNSAPVTPAAPNVTNDDAANTVTGMAAGMEYDLDGAGYVAYNATTFDGLNFSGNHTLLVRVAAEGINPASDAVTLTFTTNPVTPAAPSVTRDDTLNTVTGMAAGMEYDLDGAGYVAYVSETFNSINFAGAHTLLVRVAAEGINPVSEVVTLTFTSNPVPVTPPAPSVTNDDSANTVSGMAAGMEYNLDDAGYVAYVSDTFSSIDFAGAHTLLVRVAAEGINPVSEVVTLTFTTNTVTPPAPNVTRDDTANTVTGMAVGMEYKLDAANYVAYNATTFNALDFSGVHTLLVRVAAEGINTAGLETTLTFTSNPLEYQSATIDYTNKIVTFTFNENVVNNTASLSALKTAITFAADGQTFSALSESDTVAISGKTLVITFGTALEGCDNSIRIAANTLKNSNDVVLTSVTTATIITFDECFIATAAFGSKNQTDVVLLRHFRDQFLLTNPMGKAFVETYYQYSPPIAQSIAGNVVLKFVTRVLLLPFVAIVYMLFHPVLLMGILAGLAFMILQRRRYKALNAK